MKSEPVILGAKNRCFQTSGQTEDETAVSFFVGEGGSLILGTARTGDSPTGYGLRPSLVSAKCQKGAGVGKSPVGQVPVALVPWVPSFSDDSIARRANFWKGGQKEPVVWELKPWFL